MNKGKMMTPEEKRRDYKLRSRYKITLDQYDKMLKKQGGVCAICGRPPGIKKALDTDHCHKTGYVRGLLCMVCNRKRVGSLRDKREIWVGMRDYISKALREDKKWK